MKNIMTNIYGIIMTIYGGFISGLIAYVFITDGLYATERYELVLLVTGIPALIHGLNTLKRLWIKKALSKKDKEIEEIKQNYQLTIVDSAA